MSFDFNSEWNGTSASDIIFDIMKAKEAIAAQRFFTMNRKTKEKVFRGSAEYDEMIVENESVPDDLIISFNPSPPCGSGAPEFIKVIDTAEKDCSSFVSCAATNKERLPAVQGHSGNRKQRRAEERARRRAKKGRKQLT